MSYFLWAFLFLFAGFFMESCICFYHRSRENDKFVLAAMFSGTISLTAMLVISRIIMGVVKGPLGYWSLTYIFIFALGKSLGTYASLTLWDNLYKNSDKNSNKNRDISRDEEPG
jgi:tellurite resistance protein TehA-like permease